MANNRCRHASKAALTIAAPPLNYSAENVRKSDTADLELRTVQVRTAGL
jgi:hypothetical protein